MCTGSRCIPSHSAGSNAVPCQVKEHRCQCIVNHMGMRATLHAAAVARRPVHLAYAWVHGRGDRVDDRPGLRPVSRLGRRCRVSSLPRSQTGSLALSTPMHLR